MAFDAFLFFGLVIVILTPVYAQVDWYSTNVNDGGGALESDLLMDDVDGIKKVLSQTAKDLVYFFAELFRKHNLLTSAIDDKNIHPIRISG